MIDKYFNKTEKQITSSRKVTVIKVISIVFCILFVLTMLIGSVLYTVWKADLANIDQAKQQFLDAWNNVVLFIAALSAPTFAWKLINIAFVSKKQISTLKSSLLEGMNLLKLYIEEELNPRISSNGQFGVLIKKRVLYYSANTDGDFNTINNSLYNSLQNALGKIVFEDKKLYISKKEYYKVMGELETAKCGIYQGTVWIKLKNPKAVVQHPELFYKASKVMMEFVWSKTTQSLLHVM